MVILAQREKINLKNICFLFLLQAGPAHATKQNQASEPIHQKFWHNDYRLRCKTKDAVKQVSTGNNMMIKQYFGQYLTQLQACFTAQAALSEQLMSIQRESNDYDTVYQVITTYLKDEDHVEHFHVQGRTALDLAVAYNHFTLVRWLLKKGISKERCQHAMDQAIISGNVKLLLLINHYAQATA